MDATLTAPGGRGDNKGYVGRHRAPRMLATMPVRLGVVLTRLLGPTTTGRA